MLEPAYSLPTAGDNRAGEDLVVRSAAEEALGNLNGSVVVVDTSNGRVLAMVNQKLALSKGYMPCSTIKLVAGMAALNEGLVDEDTKVWFDGQWFMTLTEGLAISNNVYFAHLGQVMGFETVRRYANLFGFGEKAGWNIDGEQQGVFPEAEDEMGVGRMTSFGDGISVTPLQMAAYVSALANGGTLYYLQSPRTGEEIESFRPKVKRQLPIAQWIPSLEKGMAEAVRRGTGRRAKLRDQLIWGKTGTCSQYERPLRTRLGWFSSFNEIDGRRLAVVVLLRGGASHGPQAAEISGKIYQTLAQADYFTSARPDRELASADPSACCSPF